MIFAASLVLAVVSALPIQSPHQCLKSHNVIRIYSEGACDDSGEWVEFEASPNGVSAYGQSVRLDVPCDTVSSIFVPNGSGQSKLGEFPATASCVSLQAPKDLTINSYSTPNLLEISFESLFSRRDGALVKRDEDGDADCEDNCPDDEKLVKRHGQDQVVQGDIIRRHINNGPGDTDMGGDDDEDEVVKRAVVIKEWYTDGDADCEFDCGDLKKRSDDESDGEGE